MRSAERVSSNCRARVSAYAVVSNSQPSEKKRLKNNREKMVEENVWRQWTWLVGVLGGATLFYRLEEGNHMR